jgi:putative ABC transport system ATP-binding protein
MMPLFEAQTSQASALIGPSGCGKTTFLQLLSGLKPLQTGEIQVDGEIIQQLSDHNKRLFRISKIGFIFQDFGLLDYLNVEDNILHPYRINHKLELSKTIRERAKNIAAQLGISDKLKRYPQQLSQGEKQRTAIARSLIIQPKLLLADEPTGNLDPENKRAILDLLLNYVKEHQACLIVATHDHQLLEHFDQIIDFRTMSLETKDLIEDSVS